MLPGMTRAWTEHHDEAIRRACADRTLSRLARASSIPIRTLYHRAHKLGCQPQRRGLRWCEPELQMLRDLEGAGIRRMRVTLKQAGYHRSDIQIRRKLGELRMSARVDDGTMWTAEALADSLGVTARHVRRWIDAGYIPALGKATPRYLISRANIRTFLVEHPERWDHRRVDKLWLVDIMDKTRR